jgi:DNA adenine methylase
MLRHSSESRSQAGRRKHIQTKRAQIKRSTLVQPFLKWAGGKRQLLREIRKLLPQNFDVYFEPFLGAGAVLFELQPRNALINDANSELVNCYEVIRQCPEELVTHARTHQIDEGYYYRLRAQDRDPDFKNLPPLERASRTIYLNKTCYNGLFRVNKKGYFNVPFGRYANPVIVDELTIKAVSEYLNAASIKLRNDDFQTALRDAVRNDFAYLDPPYDPLSETASFTSYNAGAFDQAQQYRLKSTCDDLTQRGCKLLLSNSATDFIRDLYSDRSRYTVIEVQATRSINSNAKARGRIRELLIFNNYELAQT